MVPARATVIAVLCWAQIGFGTAWLFHRNSAKGGLVVNPAIPYGDVYKTTWVISTVNYNPDCQWDRPTVVVNGRTPGPTITVREGTRVVVTVINRQPIPVTIHWHGIRQNGSQWHDGVGGVTQCAIKQGASFTYNFSTWGEAGTFWWHAHVTMLRSSVLGGLNVIPATLKVPGRIRLPVYITGEAQIMLMDWYHTTDEEMEQQITGYPFAGWNPPDALLLNGRGYFSCPKAPIAQFLVKPWRWYRLRVVNSALYATYNFGVQYHDIFTYESEGGYLKPLKFRNYDIMSGQSYSFLLRTNQRPSAYWIGARPRYDFEGCCDVNAAVGILRYTTAPASARPRGPFFNVGPNVISYPTYTQRQLARTVGATAPPAWIRKPTKFVMLEVNEHLVVDPRNSSQTIHYYSFNNFTTVLPHAYAPLLAEYSGNYKLLNVGGFPSMPPPGFDAYSNSGASKVGFGVIDIPYGAVVHMVMQGHQPPGLNHPMHLHGFNFYVVGQGVGRYDMSKWQKYKYNLANPVYRNTEWLLEGYWTAARWYADNPGIWLLHCHLEPHVDGGMMAIFRVHKPKGIPPPPKDYPKCR